MRACVLIGMALGACSFGGAPAGPDADLPPGDSDTGDDGADADGSTGDDGLPVDAPIDGMVDRTCTFDWMNGPVFGTPRVQIGGPRNEQDVFVHADDQLAFYSSAGTLFMARRNPGTGNWMEQTPPTGLDGPADEVDKVVLTADDNVFVSTARGNSETYNIYESKLSGGMFSAPTTARLQAVNSSGDQIYDPHVTADGLRLYFAPLRGTQTIKVAERTSPTASFGNVRGVPGLETGADNADPTLSADERVIVFLSDRSGAAALYYAVRPSRDTAFLDPISIPSSLVGATASSPHLSPDGCTLYFSSELGTDETPDIYSLTID